MLVSYNELREGDFIEVFAYANPSWGFAFVVPSRYTNTIEHSWDLSYIHTTNECTKTLWSGISPDGKFHDLIWRPHMSQQEQHQPEQDDQSDGFKSEPERRLNAPDPLQKALAEAAAKLGVTHDIAE